MSASERLRQLIQDEAHRLGFKLVGVTTPDPPRHYAAYENWLAADRHGEMAYLASERARQRRAEPCQIMPECRSILVLGTPYFSPDIIPNQEDGQLGRVAAYAWGEDYHDVLVKRLAALATFIQIQVGEPVNCRWYTDTGPILERDLAQSAGLGWIGKNTCLIHPEMGSYFLLAELLLDIELVPDIPFIFDRCGSCTRCIEACPTGCILPNRVLDARRCISYLTIELKGAIPAKQRPHINQWIFGCDICQQVCPWNRFAVPQGDPAFAPRPGLSMPDLIEEILLTEEAFRRKFKDSPVKRSRRQGYLRNVAVALGNLSNPAVVPVLEQALGNESEPIVREHILWALEQLSR